MAVIGLNTHVEKNGVSTSGKVADKHRQNKSPHREARLSREQFRQHLLSNKRFELPEQLSGVQITENLREEMQNCANCIEGQGGSVDQENCRRQKCTGFYATLQ